MSQDQNINSHCSTHVIRVFNHIAKGIGHCRNISGRIIRISRHRPSSIGDRRQTPHSIIHPCGRIIPSIGLRYQPPIDIVIARLRPPGSIRFRDRYAIQRYPLLRIRHTRQGRCCGLLRARNGKRHHRFIPAPISGNLHQTPQFSCVS